MSSQLKCVRLEFVYEGGGHFLLTGEPAEKHLRYLDKACYVAWLHGYSPEPSALGDRTLPPQGVAAEATDSREMARLDVARAEVVSAVQRKLDEVCASLASEREKRLRLVGWATETAGAK